VFRDQGPLIGRCCSYLVVNDPRLPPAFPQAFSLQGFFLPERVNRLILHLRIIPVNPLPLCPCLAFFQVFRRRLVIASSSFFVKQT
jgi:hypothetical protein